MFDGCFAAPSRLPLRIFVDTAASHKYVSQQLLELHGLGMKKKGVMLKLVDGHVAMSQGVCDMPLRCNLYQVCTKFLIKWA